jgi:hypothetical protein
MPLKNAAAHKLNVRPRKLASQALYVAMQQFRNIKVRRCTKQPAMHPI